MSDLCRAFKISRQTGYKWISRFVEHGPRGLEDLPRAPHQHPNAVSEEITKLILQTRGLHPKWGPLKLRAWLERKNPRLALPAPSTIGDILKRHGLAAPRRRRHRVPPYEEPFKECRAPNTVWCADFKGWFLTQDGLRIDPLTISDAHSRFLIRCQAVPKTDFEHVWRIFEASFIEYGLPDAIRTDNGAPFATRAVAGLSRLSIRWIRLGIRPERIAPGKPQQNGRHERMHLTLKNETASPSARNARAQQRRFDEFRQEFNFERPHQALGQQTPATLYTASGRPWTPRLAEIEYPDTMLRRKVFKQGWFSWKNRCVFLSETLRGETVGLEPVDDGVWQVYFGPLALILIDERGKRVKKSNGAGAKGEQ
jgi:transposase InsO family protein